MVLQRHPPGLVVLFFTEMWERFSFYCMLALFVLYMTDEGNGHPFLQDNADQLYGLYLGFVYFTPFFGGMLADQKWGYRLAILVGAFCMGVGQFLLAADPLPFFFAGLTCLIIGNGLFKPNISTLVGKLYAPNDPRLDNAFTIFYMGINIGALISPLVAGYLRVRYGYHVAFAAAGVGMGISIVIFLLFQRTLVFERGDRKQPVPDPHVSPKLQRERHIALLVIFGVVALFWMAFKQNGNTFTRWWKDCTDRAVPEWLAGADFLQENDNPWFPAEWSVCINPLFVILFSPVLVMLWAWLKARRWEPTTPAKVGIGMVLCALAFGVMMVGGLAGGDVKGQRVSMAYLVGAYLLLTLGELCLSPMGLSLVSKLAAPRQRSAWMGGWFVATAIGGYLSGLVGVWWPHMPHSRFFFFLALTSLGAFAVLCLFHRRLRAAVPDEPQPAAAETPHPLVEDVPTSITVIGGPRT